MVSNKNHEGYPDPTAGKAIKRADRGRKHRKKHLIYRLGDLPVFQKETKNIR